MSDRVFDSSVDMPPAASSRAVDDWQPVGATSPHQGGAGDVDDWQPVGAAGGRRAFTALGARDIEGPEALRPEIEAAQPATFAERFGRPLSGPVYDMLFSADNNYAKHGYILSAFGQGSNEGWGARAPGFSKETETSLKQLGVYNDFAQTQSELAKAANSVYMRPSAARMDATWRASTALTPFPEQPETDQGPLSAFGRAAGQALFGGVGAAVKSLAEPRAIDVATGNAPSLEEIKGSLPYRLGEAMQEQAPHVSEQQQKLHPWASAAGNVVGSLLAPIAGTVAAGPRAGVAVGAAEMGLASAGSTFDEAIEKGATVENAARAANLTGLTDAALGVLPLSHVLAPIRQAAPGMLGWATAKLAQAGANGVVFTGVGEAQHYLDQQVAQTFYDPEAGYSFDPARAAASLVVGGAFGAIHPLTGAREARLAAPVAQMLGGEPLSPAEIAAARRSRVIGAGEEGWKGTPAEPTTEQLPGEPPEVAAAPKPDVQSAARAAEPDLFGEWDALLAQRNELRQLQDQGLAKGELSYRHLRAIENALAEIEPRVQDALRAAADQVAAPRVTAEGAAVTAPAPGSSEELAAMLKSGASPDELAAHPVVAAAQTDNDSRPETNHLPGYGTPEFEAAREFNFNGEHVTGYDNAIPRLADKAESYSTDGPVKAERIATLVLGPPTSGKSRLSERLAARLHAAIVDPDDAKQVLPEYEGGLGTSATHEESADIAGRVLRRLMSDGKNIILPRVGGKLDSVRNYVDDLTAAGYRVNLANLTVHPDEAYRRMIRRFLKTGRIIGSNYFSGIGTKPRENYYIVKGEGKVHEAVDIDGNPPPGHPDFQRILDGSDTELSKAFGRPGRGDRSSLADSDQERGEGVAGEEEGGQVAPPPRTGIHHVDAILSDPETAAAIANPKINRDQDVPYTAGPDNTGNGLNLDRHLPQQLTTASGKTFDPAKPYAIHEFVERDAMKKLIAGGMDDATAYKVAHWEFAERAEHAWYLANGIDPAEAEAAAQPFIDQIQHEKLAKGDGDVPADLFKRPYPHDNVDAAHKESSGPAPKPTQAEIDRALEILNKSRAEESAPRPSGQAAPAKWHIPDRPILPDPRAAVAEHVRQQLAAAAEAGAPLDRYQIAASARVIASFFDTLARDLEGKLGTAWDLYRAEGPEIIGPGARSFYEPRRPPGTAPAAVRPSPAPSGPESAAAAAPRESGIPSLGAPVPGMPEHRVVSAGGPAVEVSPRVVEAADLITSSDQGYDTSLQPRQRERAASQAQIRDIAANLNPEMLGRSSEADRGAPIVGPDSMVESGNGRVLALRAVYAQNGDAAARYRDWLSSQGVDIGKYLEPVLIRERVTPLDPDQRRAFTVAGNQAATLAMSAPERAMADARHVDGSLLDLVRNPEDLGAAANRDFVRAFVAKLPQTEQGAMVAADGRLSAEGLARIRNAVLARAYGNADVLARVAESTNDEIKSISNALVAAAPDWAKLAAETADGRVRADLDLTKPLVEAVSRAADLRARGETLAASLAQRDAFAEPSPVVENFLRMFYDAAGRRAASAVKIADALRFYAREARKVTTDDALDLGLPKVAAVDIQGAAVQVSRAGAVRERTPELAQARLYQEAGPPADIEDAAALAIADRLAVEEAGGRPHGEDVARRIAEAVITHGRRLLPHAISSVVNHVAGGVTIDMNAAALAAQAIEMAPTMAASMRARFGRIVDSALALASERRDLADVDDAGAERLAHLVAMRDGDVRAAAAWQLEEAVGDGWMAAKPSGVPVAEWAGLRPEPPTLYQAQRRRDLYGERERLGQIGMFAPAETGATLGQQAQRSAAAPLRPKQAQLPMDVGLFGERAPQIDLFARGESNVGGARGELAGGRGAEQAPGPAGGPRGGEPGIPGNGAVGARAPAVPPGKPARLPRRTPVERPEQLSLFGGGGGEQQVQRPHEPVPGEPGGEEHGAGGTGDSVTKPPTGGGGDSPTGADLAAAAGRPRSAVRGLSKAEEKIAERSRKNYRVTDDDKIGDGGAKEKVRANLDAIRTLKEIEDDSREATPEEKAILVKYTGWGAHAQIMFGAAERYQWADERATLRALLNDEEYEAARASTPNAHYTSPQVVRGIWAALDHLGFKGGSALEPAAGVGHFIGMIPDNIAAKTSWSAVEKDSISARITKALYGGTEVNEGGFEDFKRPSNNYDLAISNVPFGSYNLQEKPYGSYPIHDFFFVKSLDKVRPGGMVAFVTSRYSMDRVDPTTRQLWAKSADLVGAIRLPGGSKGAFAGNAGTEVTTDILFLRKKISGEAPFQTQPWENLKEIETPEGKTSINEYFADHPEMMLGEMRLQGSMYRSNEPVLIGDTDDIQNKIAQAAQRMQEDAITPMATPPPDTIHASEITGAVKDGAFFVQDGKVFQRVAGQGIDAGLSAADQDKVAKLVGIRDIYNDLIGSQLRGENAEAQRAALRDAYDSFVATHGPINLEQRTITKRLDKKGRPIVRVRHPNFDAFRSDPDAFKVAAIENYNSETGKAERAPAQTRDVISPPTERKINGPADALAAALDDKGTVDLDHIANSLGLDTHEDAAAALGDMVFHNPDGRQWETADRYLSGDVVKKLEDARAIAASDPSYERNVAALEKVQPTPLTRYDITAQFGAPWIPTEAYEEFFRSLGSYQAKVLRNPLTGEYRLDIPVASRDAEARFGTDRVGMEEVAAAAMNNRTLTVYGPPDPEGKKSVDPKRTQEANAKVDLMKEEFAGDQEAGREGWVWQDDDRARQLEALYNRTFNNLAPRKFDGSHLTLPGLNPDFATRSYRKDSVWRMVQNGNTLLAHVVGAGKTTTMIAGGMEMKRLGLVNKPAYVVPNHMLEQFSREFIQAYPNAKILVAQKDEMTRENRKSFVAKMAANDWDGVIITHDAFCRIGVSNDVRREFVSDRLREVNQMLSQEQAAEKGAKSWTVKKLEAAKQQYLSKLNTLLNEGRKDEGTTFEETGIDHLFIDEAHKFKNLEYQTRMTKIKGLGQGNAQRAEDLFLKIQHLERRRPGRSAVFATGTPISNTMAELWTMMRYLELGNLKERGLDNFDTWASTFGKAVTNMELSADGRTFKEVTSFSRFVNIPELMNIYSEVADTKTADMLNLERPDVVTHDGKPGIEIVEATPSDDEEKHIQYLVNLADQIKGKSPKKGEPNMLSIVTSGRKIATDGRLIGSDFKFNPDGKIAKAVENIHRIWTEGNADPVAPNKVQMIFLDMGTPKKGKAAPKPVTEEEDDGEEQANQVSVDIMHMLRKHAKEIGQVVSPVLEVAPPSPMLDLYSDIKGRLIDKGIPADQIAFIHDAATDDAKARLFDRVRRGEVRVFIGSTEKMGVGTNVQDRLIAMHHLDAPWKPAEVEQRDGRIVRQGNKNSAVQIYRYVTARSFDAFMWQKLDTKSKFIAQVLSGARGSRHAEDIDNPLPEAAEMKAAASGDPRILEHAELDRAVRQLTVQRNVFQQTKARADSELKAAQSRIAQYDEAIPAAKADAAAAAEDISGDKFKVTLGGKEVADRTEAGQEVLAGLLDAADKTAARYRPILVNVGRMAGLDMQVELERRWSGDGEILAATFSLRGKKAYSSPSRAVINKETPPRGLIARFENILGNLRTQPERLTQLRDAEQRGLPGLQRTLTGTWPKEQDYRSALDRLKALEKDMGGAKHPDVVAAEAPSVPEQAPEATPELEQRGIGKTARGGFTPRQRQGMPSLVRLAATSDASTFMHEAAHDFLRIYAKYGEHPDAPADFKGRIAAMMKEIGVDRADDLDVEAHPKGAAFQTAKAAHERFTHWFEQWLREGHAPSPEMKSVFESFKQWLADIYHDLVEQSHRMIAAGFRRQTGQELPLLSDSMRSFFERMLTGEPRDTIITPARERPSGLADTHDADSETIAPGQGEALGGMMDAEHGRARSELPKEVRDEIESERAKLAEAGPQPAGEGGALGGGGAGAGGRSGVAERVPEGGGGGVPSAPVSASDREGVPERSAKEPERQPAGVNPPPVAAHEPFAPSSPLVDKAGNFVLPNITNREDVRQAIRDSVGRNNEFIEDRRGVIGDAQASSLADAMGLAVADLDRRQIGEAWNKEQIIALEKLFIQAANSVADAAKAARDAGTDESFIAYGEAEARQRMILDAVARHASGVRAEAGRALQAYAALKKMVGHAEAHALSDLINELPTGATLLQLKQRVMAISALGTPAQVAGAINQMAKPGLGAYALEIFKNWLISGPMTHATYWIGNQLLSLWKAVPETASIATASRMREALGGAPSQGAHYGEVGAQLYSMFKGQRDGVRAAHDAFLAGQTKMLPHEELDMMTKSERARYDALIAAGDSHATAVAKILGVTPPATTAFTTTNVIPGMIGAAVRIPGERMVAPIHSYSRTINYLRSVAQQAYRTATNENLPSVAAFEARVAALTVRPTEEMMRVAREEATQLTLMGQGGGFTRAVSRMVNYEWNLPGLGPTKPLAFIDPFTKIFSNIVEEGVIKRSVVGLLSPTLRADIRAGGIRSDVAVGRMAMGTILGVVAGGLAMEGLLTPSAPSDPKEAETWRRYYGLPHSLRLGNMSVDLSRLGALGVQMGIAADLYQMVDRIGKDDVDKLASLLVHSFVQNFMDEGFMRGPSDMIKALDDPDHQGAKYISGLASSMAVPYSVGSAQLAAHLDPYAREARGLLDQIKIKVPWWRETLPPRIDLWGQPVASPDWAGVKTQPLANDPIDKALIDLGYYPSPVERRIRGVELTPQQHADYARIAGQLARMKLETMVQAPWFVQMPPGQRQEMIKKAIDSSREQASTAVQMQPGNGGIVRTALEAKRLQATEGREPAKALRKAGTTAP